MVTGEPGDGDVAGLATQPVNVRAPGPGPGPVPLTVTTAVDVTDPFLFVAVSVYVVVVVGLTGRVPVACTVPSELIATESAFSTDQLRVEELPEVIVAGDAVKLTTRGAAPVVT